MVALFAELGPEHPLTVQYRRRLASVSYELAGSGLTTTVSAIAQISVAGRSARVACSRIFSGLEAS